MRKINCEHIKAVLGFLGHCNYFNLIDLKVVEIAPGYSRVELVSDTKHHNPFGMIQGGVYASVLDSAAFWSVYCDLEEDSGFVTLDLKVDYLSAAKEGKLIAEGKCIKAGRTVCLSEAKVTDESGRLLAHATSKQMVTQGRQSIKQSAAAIGIILPPKFSV